MVDNEVRKQRRGRFQGGFIRMRPEVTIDQGHAATGNPLGEGHPTDNPDSREDRPMEG